MVHQFPMNIYVRYVDIFHENGLIYMRRFPVTSVTTAETFVLALRTLGILTNEDRWQLKKWGEHNDYENYTERLYMEREILWITDGEQEYASYMIFPSDLDAIYEFPEEEELTNVVQVDFRKRSSVKRA